MYNNIKIACSCTFIVTAADLLTESFRFPGVQKPIEEYGSQTSGGGGATGGGGDDDDDDDDDFELFGSDDEEVSTLICSFILTSLHKQYLYTYIMNIYRRRKKLRE